MYKKYWKTHRKICIAQGRLRRIDIRKRKYKRVANVNRAYSDYYIEHCYNKCRRSPYLRKEFVYLNDYVAFKESIKQHSDSKELMIEDIKSHIFNPFVVEAIKTRYDRTYSRFISNWRFRSAYMTMISHKYFDPSYFRIVEKHRNKKRTLLQTYRAIACYINYYKILEKQFDLIGMFAYRDFHGLHIEDIVRNFPEFNIHLLHPRNTPIDYVKRMKKCYGIYTENQHHIMLFFDEFGSCSAIIDPDMEYLHYKRMSDKRLLFLLSGFGITNTVIEGYYSMYEHVTNTRIDVDWREITGKSATSKPTNKANYEKFYPNLDMIDMMTISEYNNETKRPEYPDRYLRMKTFFDGIKSQRYHIADMHKIKTKKDFNDAKCIITTSDFFLPNK